jgi:hypothetical protein
MTVTVPGQVQSFDNVAKIADAEPLRELAGRSTSTCSIGAAPG